MLPNGSSPAVSSLERSVPPVAASPGLLSGDSFPCLIGWMQSGSSLADSCSSEKNWEVVMVPVCYHCTVLVKDLKAVVASGEQSCWILLCMGLKCCNTMKGSAVMACNLYCLWWPVGSAQLGQRLWVLSEEAFELKKPLKHWRSGVWARPSTKWRSPVCSRADVLGAEPAISDKLPKNHRQLF